MYQTTTYQLLLIIAVLWTLPWKGIALWKSARNGELAWFIALLVINTLGLLEILYIFFLGKKDKKDEISNFSKIENNEHK
ncbi:MAG: DUF5652 family protein [Candidatus Pacebacteria bacterium]|jgi:hypothetical protein|nr:DUF5652 family protein [Candidatus Paceibacterota bacterium]MDD3072235.1 DUF5652 family protein [Candidatus Paceibacterota bacterium]MDD3729062.1 DUF5652 family protein [Candidatus Paceibacterota bacterium]MDD4201192.1 DUF5652 family protein [Candidatus Paceibacterota bacterium]MDD4467309.1 DUF5652 family protein [Candidatus Paceibacterota bacterium]